MILLNCLLVILVAATPTKGDPTTMSICERVNALTP